MQCRDKGTVVHSLERMPDSVLNPRLIFINITSHRFQFDPIFEFNILFVMSE